MTPTAPAAAAGVARPSANNAPAPVSDPAASTALRLPGFMPIESKPLAVPSSPGPPNQPNSFCVPCAKNVAPSATRRTVRPNCMTNASREV